MCGHRDWWRWDTWIPARDRTRLRCEDEECRRAGPARADDEVGSVVISLALGFAPRNLDLQHVLHQLRAGNVAGIDSRNIGTVGRNPKRHRANSDSPAVHQIRVGDWGHAR